MAIEKFTIARNDDIYECFPYILPFPKPAELS